MSVDGLLVVLFILAASYLVLMIVTLCRRIILGRRTTGLAGKWSGRKLCLSFISTSCFLRCVYFTYIGLHPPHLHHHGDLSYPPTLFILEGVPAFLFVVVEVFTIMFWVEMYYYAKLRAPIKHLRVITNVVASLVLCIMCLMYFAILVCWHFQWDSWQRGFRVASYAFLSLLFICCAILFAFYGTSLFIKFGKFPGLSVTRKRSLLRIGLVTFSTVVAFTFRAPVILYQLDKEDLNSSPWVIGVYYFLCEVVPLSLLVLLLGTTPPAAKKNTPPLMHGPASRPITERYGVVNYRPNIGAVSSAGPMLFDAAISSEEEDEVEEEIGFASEAPADYSGMSFSYYQSHLYGADI
eukprot:TRINITY_DN1443_c0_g2_i1.p1 TRINITY_DN1443_c0_g2~~TRINITY_DN1443_c0_g2_i1.p1  ORF type:complete len:351 (-),score=57.73 TRINITY_DN1443_c0_g2_i1:90-1142(-)